MSESAKKFKTASRALTHILVGSLFVTWPIISIRGQSGPVSPSQVSEVVAQLRSATSDTATLSNGLALGRSLILEKRFVEAAELFKAVLDRDPQNATALYGAALSAFNLGQTEEADRLARAAVTATGGNSDRFARAAVSERTLAADSLVLLAVVLAVRGDDPGALKSAKQAVKIARNHFDAQFTLGRALYSVGDMHAASEAFRVAASLNPGDQRALFFLGTTLERTGDLAGAISAYRVMIARQPQAAEGHLGLGTLLVRRGASEQEEGIRELKRAVELKPDLYEARVTLGRVLVARGRSAEAVEHLVRASELAPGNPEPQYQLSMAYQRLRRYDKAAEAIKAVRRIHETRRASGPEGKTQPPQP